MTNYTTNKITAYIEEMLDNKVKFEVCDNGFTITGADAKKVYEIKTDDICSSLKKTMYDIRFFHKLIDVFEKDYGEFKITDYEHYAVLTYVQWLLDTYIDCDGEGFDVAPPEEAPIIADKFTSIADAFINTISEALRIFK